MAEGDQLGYVGENNYDGGIEATAFSKEDTTCSGSLPQKAYNTTTKSSTKSRQLLTAKNYITSKL